MQIVVSTKSCCDFARLRPDDGVEGFRSYRPAIAEDVSQPAVEREISRLNAAIEKVVVSNGLKPDEVEGWGPTRVACS